MNSFSNKPSSNTWHAISDRCNEAQIQSSTKEIQWHCRKNGNFRISYINSKTVIQIKKEKQNIRLTWAAIIPFLIVLPVFVFSKMVCTMMIQELLRDRIDFNESMELSNWLGIKLKNESCKSLKHSLHQKIRIPSIQKSLRPMVKTYAMKFVNNSKIHWKIGSRKMDILKCSVLDFPTVVLLR